MIKSFLLIICFCFVFIGNAQYEIKGTVKDDAGKPIEKVKVTLQGMFSGYTNPRGEFRIPCSALEDLGEIEVSIQKEKWALFEPSSGLCQLPSRKNARNQKVSLVLIPHGSPKFSSHEQLQNVMKDYTVLKFSNQRWQSMSLKDYLNEYGRRVGLTDEQLQKGLEAWEVATKDSKDFETLALRQEYKGNFIEAAHEYGEGARSSWRNFKKASKEREEAAIKFFDFTVAQARTLIRGGEQVLAYKAISSACDSLDIMGYEKLLRQSRREKAYLAFDIARTQPGRSMDYWLALALKDIDWIKKSYPSKIQNYELSYAYLLEGQLYIEKISRNGFIGRIELFEEATALLDSSKVWFEKNGFYRPMANVMIAIGVACVMAVEHDIENSDYYFRKGSENLSDVYYLAEMNNDFNYQTTVLNNLGLLFSSGNRSCVELDSANWYFESARYLYEYLIYQGDFTDFEGLARLTLNAGDLIVRKYENGCEFKHDLGEIITLSRLQGSIEVRRNRNDNVGLARTYYTMGRISLFQNADKDAENYFKKALESLPSEDKLRLCNTLYDFYQRNPRFNVTMYYKVCW